jgi:hypothetical protein
LRVRLTERALGLKQRASATPSSLDERASETALDGASDYASVRVSTHRDFASLRLAVIVLDAVFQNSITQTFLAEDARLAFDLAENEPGRTIKVQLDFTG